MPSNDSLGVFGNNNNTELCDKALGCAGECTYPYKIHDKMTRCIV